MNPKFQQACIVATRLANQTGADHRIFKAYGNYCVRPASADYDGEHMCLVRQSHFGESGPCQCDECRGARAT